MFVLKFDRNEMQSFLQSLTLHQETAGLLRACEPQFLTCYAARTCLLFVHVFGARDVHG